jgi:signal transduction histidine kinase
LIFAPVSSVLLAQKPSAIGDLQRNIWENHKKQVLHEVDSILPIVEKMPDDTSKALRFIELSDLLSVDSANATFAFAEKAKALSEKLHFKMGIARALAAIATILQNKKEYEKALGYYLQAMDIIDTYDNVSPTDNFYSSALNICFYLGDYPRAMTIATRGLGNAERNNNKLQTAQFSNIVGYINCQQGNLEEAKKYYDRYLTIATAMDDRFMMAHAYSEVSEVFVKSNQYRQALSCLFKSIDLFRRGMEIVREQKQNTPFSLTLTSLAKIKYLTGRVYKLMGEYKTALAYSLEAVDEIQMGGSNNYDIASYYINAGDVYRYLGNYTAATGSLKKGLQLAEDIQHRENIRDANNYLAQTYALQKKYDSAFFFFSRYVQLKDSIVNNETKMKIAGIQGQYDVARKDKEIEKEQQIRNILIGSFAFLLVILLLLYNGYRLKQKNRYQQSLNRQQNELFNAIVSTQDQERKRIAQDIHDSLGSVLSAVKLKLSSLKETPPLLSAEQQEKYHTALSLLDEASSELRNISHNIMPATLSKLGIVAALQNLIGKISSHSGLQVQFSAHGFDGRLDESTEISIYRIVLELINNVVKHAEADKVTVQMIKYPSYINLTVEDNGKGFDYEKALEQKKGIGLGNIASRVEYLNGTLSLDSSAGKGTTVIIDIPYKDDPKNTNNLV